MLLRTIPLLLVPILVPALACAAPDASPRTAALAISRATYLVARATVTAPDADAPAAALAPSKLPGLSNFARVSPTLYRGAQPKREGYAQLKSIGVRTVVNLRSGSDDADDARPARKAGLNYVSIPCQAASIGDDQVIPFLRVVTDPANQPVFVHCRRGADRTGLAVAAYRVVVMGWTADAAAAELPVFHHNSIYTNVARYLRHIDPWRIWAMVADAPAPGPR